ncbi:uncharacterized protein LOC135710036 [Ochlerotatus camptorhynchus]|uniref:uncharacterized protein LOC135710036 n=1 Tax=Ochlerotatus camptorhynchus TaxID=644619 RepID=UPI0031CE2EBA
MIADVELINEADEIPELRNLLVEDWDLDPTVYAILINHGITLSYLKDLDEKALNDVFLVIKWTGHKHSLRSKLEHWDESVLFRPPSINQLNEPTPSSSQQENVYNTQPGPFKRKLLPTAVTNNLFLDILQRNEKGKIVTQHYIANHRLDVEHKRFLAHTVVDYYIANDNYFNLADMERFAQLIAARFPPEIAETYYNPRDFTANKMHPSGLLYDRFHNRNKKSLISRRATIIDHWKECKADDIVTRSVEQRVLFAFAEFQ